MTICSGAHSGISLAETEAKYAAREVRSTNLNISFEDAPPPREQESNTDDTREDLREVLKVQLPKDIAECG